MYLTGGGNNAGMYERVRGSWRRRAGLSRGYLELDLSYHNASVTRYVDVKIDHNWDPDFALDLLAVEYLD